MKIAKKLFAFILIGFFLMAAGCPGNSEKAEKGPIEKQTDKVAKAAVKMMKTPIEKAKVAAEQVDRHNQQVQQQTKSE